MSGYSAFGNTGIFYVNASIFLYVALMIVSFVMMLVGSESKIEVNKNDTNKFCKSISVLSLLWSILMTWSF